MAGAYPSTLSENSGRGSEQEPELSWDYLHLVTHPFPIVLVTIGMGSGLLGWVLNREELERYGIISLLIAGALAIPSYGTGLAAADVVAERTFVQPSIVQTHRTWATFAAFALLTCGVFALFSLLQPSDRRLRRFVFIIAVPTAMLTAFAALRGGKIEHDADARADSVSAVAVESARNEPGVVELGAVEPAATMGTGGRP